jgi:uncharacterized protein YkwD
MRFATTAALLSVGVAGVVISSCVFAPAPAHADGAVSTVSDGLAGDQGAAVLRQVNATRVANGCRPLAADPQLSASAARQASDMLVNNVQGHTGSDGSSVAQRVNDAGNRRYIKLAEVVFWSTATGDTPAAAVAAWMNSPGHRAIISDCDLTEAGFSAASDGQTLTVAGDFGAP